MGSLFVLVPAALLGALALALLAGSSESARARRGLLRTYLSPRTLVGSIRLLARNDTALWYTSLGDEVIEGMDEGFRDPKKALWLNIGYWKEARTYPDACAAMARLLADSAGLAAEDEVLDVGFGFGDQDLLWAERYGPRRIVGINITPLHVKVAGERVKERRLEGTVDLRLGSATEIPFPERSFSKVFALECAFHFDTRERFFREALRVLRPGGKLALADMLPLPGRRPNLRGSWFMRQRSGWPAANMYDRDEYVRKLEAAGFGNVRCTSIREHVYPGMYRYVMQRYAGKRTDEIEVTLSPDEVASCAGADLWERSMGVSDYVIVTAEKPPS